MKSAIVTGANGFLGKYLVAELLRQDYFVYALIHDKNRCNLIDNINLKIIECNMDNYKNISDLIKAPIDIIFHLAWEGVEGENRANYDLQLKNVKCSCDLLNSAVKMNVKRFINFGSIIEFEYENTFKEHNYTIVTSYIYSIAKITARNMMINIANNNGIEFIPLILANVYGPYDPSNRFIKNIMTKLIKKEQINLSSCEQFYDFIYITDATKAIIEVAKIGRKNEFYYIGNKKQKKLKEYVEKIKNLINDSAILNYGVIKNNCQMDYTKINTTLLTDEIKYFPEVDFDTGIKITYEWLKNEI